MRTQADHLAPILEHPGVRTLADRLAEGARTSAVGASGSSTVLVAGALAVLLERPALLVVAHLDDAEEAVDMLAGVGVPAARLPALEVLPGETAVALDLFAERLNLIERVRSGTILGAGKASVLVCPVQALMQRIPSAARADRLTMTVRAGEERSPEGIVGWLADAGYQRLDSIEEPGDFALRGGILDVFPASADETGAVRIDFFGDEIESINEIDLDTMGSDRRVESVEFVAKVGAEALVSDDDEPALHALPAHCVALLAETLEVVEQGRGYYERVSDSDGIVGPPEVLRTLRDRFCGFCEINQFTAAGSDAVVELPARPLPEFSRNASEAVGELAELARTHALDVLCANEGELSRFGELRGEFAPGAELDARVAYLHRGFLWGDEDEHPFALVPYHELLHRYQTRRRIRRIKGARSSDAFLELSVGDYVVHQDHGIAKFLGLKQMAPKRAPSKAKTSAKRREQDPEEYLTLEFAKGAKLHVPVAQIDRVSKYVGGFSGKPPLSTIGGKRWQRQKEDAKESVRDMAAELLRVQAAREHAPGIRFPEDTPWQREFEAEFPYTETEDQLAALSEIKRDMTGARPMDRLLCGDVGFGKTELAVRAAFKCVESGRQAAVLVPTTILAEQHERTFRARFADYPFSVASVSRFKSTKEQNETLMKLRKGHVDVIIGTHRLLSKDVRFNDLGLVVVDEEQRFGVEHKNALLKLRVEADVLTLSATPIPRTLHMSMLGLRDISSLTTAPTDRRATVTEVIPYNETRLGRAIARELAREGQVYVVNNRVHNIKSVADDIQRLAPGARVVVGHGQMDAHKLEDVMLRFVRREADILVATTIVESGLDIPTANTMVILDADRFGLASLHQLRGRVGRYKHRAYCYLCLPKDRTVNEVAVKRLKAIEEYAMLGAGFKIAMRDLEIRGAGNLLGAEQSGHIAAVGYDMYCKLLEQAAKELRQEPTREASETSVDLGVAMGIPALYIPSQTRRLEAYRRIGAAQSVEELEQVRAQLVSAYGPLPAPAQRLIDLTEIRLHAFARTIRSITRRDDDIVFRAEDVAPVLEAFEGAEGSVRPLTKKAGQELFEVYYRPPKNYLEAETLLAVLRKRLGG
ncbi:MAG: transcription-repair coupling factor [Phycisphaerales bacterium]